MKRKNSDSSDSTTEDSLGGVFENITSKVDKVKWLFSKVLTYYSIISLLFCT